MLSNFILLLIVLLLGIPLALFVALKLRPQATLVWADGLAYKALDVGFYNQTSPYNKAGFKPVHTLCDELELTPSNSIPADIDGVFLRNGTNLQFEETDGRYHMFNGAGMLHQIQIGGGNATYSNTYVKTPRYQIEDRAGKDLYLHFGDLAGGGKAGFARMSIASLKQRFGVLPALDVLESGYRRLVHLQHRVP